MRLGRTRRLRAEYGPGAGAADAARHPAGDGAESSVAPSSDRVAASFTPHRTALRRGRAGSDVVFTQGCKHQVPPFCSVSCARSFPVRSPASSSRSSASTLRTLSIRISARSPFNRSGATFPPPRRRQPLRRAVHGHEDRARRAVRPAVRDRRHRWSRCPSRRRASVRTPAAICGRDLRIHRPALGQQSGVHAQQLVLQFGGVRRHRAPEDLGGPGHGGELRRHQTAGERLGDGERLAPHRRVVAPRRRPSELDRFRLSSRRRGLARSRRVPLARRSTMACRT